MSLHFNFTYKPSDKFKNGQISGFVLSENAVGDKGLSGKVGSRIHFVKTSLDNTYYKDEFLSSINEKEYHISDLIMTPDRKVYKLIANSNDSQSTYDVKYMGSVVRPPYNEDEISYYDIASVDIDDIRYSLERCPVPTTRGLDSSLGPYYIDASNNHLNDRYGLIFTSTDTSTFDKKNYPVNYANAFRGLYGVKFSPKIILSGNSERKAWLEDNYDFYLRINLRNQRRYQNGCYSLRNKRSNRFGVSDLINHEKDRHPITREYPNDVDLNKSDIKFYKVAEFPLLKSNETDLPIFVSDYVADKMHPSGNDISMNFGDSRNQAYRLSIDGDQDKWSNAKIIPGTDTSVYFIDDYHNTSSAYDNNYEKCFSIYDTSTYSDNHIYIQYYKRVGLKISKDSNNRYIKKEYTDPSSGISKYLTYINQRGGDSAFFSSMIPQIDSTYTGRSEISGGANENATYDQYVSYIKSLNPSENHIAWGNTRYIDSAMIEYYTKEYVANEIDEFLFNNYNLTDDRDDKGDKNIYELVCVNKKTKKTTIISISNTKINRHYIS